MMEMTRRLKPTAELEVQEHEDKGADATYSHDNVQNRATQRLDVRDPPI